MPVQKTKHTLKSSGANEKEKKKTMRTFSAATFLNDFGAEMVNSIWPLFITSFLGANMEILGLIDGLGEALVSISQAISGYVSDRIKKRKVFIWTGYVAGAISRLGYAATTTWPAAIPFRILDRTGKIRGAPRDAMVADISTHKDRGKNFGILRTMDNSGALAGIIAGIIILSFLGVNYQTMFLIAAVPSVLGAGAILFFIKERKMHKLKLYKGITFSNLNRDFRIFLVLSSIFALGSFSYSFLLIFAKQAGFGAAMVPVLYFVFTLFAAIFSLPFGKLSDAIGRKNVMYIALFIWVLTCLVFIFINALWAIALTFVLYGLHHAALDPVQKTFVAELAPKKFRSSALGAFQMAIGLCALPASVVAGVLWDKVNPIAPFVLSLGLTIVAMALLFFVKENKNA